MRMNPIGGNNEAKATVISNGLKGKLLCMMNFLSTNPDIIQAHSGRMNCSLMGGYPLNLIETQHYPTFPNSRYKESVRNSGSSDIFGK